MMQQIMDLKLQLAECLAENDTLKHKNGLLTKHNDELIREGSDLANDLDGAYTKITKLKHERDEAVRHLTRAQMLQIRRDSRRAKLLLAGNDSSADTQSGNGSSGSLDEAKSKSGTNSYDANKGGSWLSRLSVNFRASSLNTDGISSSSSTKVVDPNSSSSSSKITKTTSIATLQSISDSTRNLFNNSTLSFLSSDLGLSSESPRVAVKQRRGQGDGSSSSLLAANDILPGRRSSIIMDAASCSEAMEANSSAVNCNASKTKTTNEVEGRYAHRSTDRDVQDFLSRHSMSSINSGLLGESDSEEEFDDYFVDVPKDRPLQDEDAEDGGGYTDKQCNRRNTVDTVDTVRMCKDEGVNSVALGAYRLPKRLSLNACEA